jgi:hypothetical protein
MRGLLLSELTDAEIGEDNIHASEILQEQEFDTLTSRLPRKLRQLAMLGAQ